MWEVSLQDFILASEEHGCLLRVCPDYRISLTLLPSSLTRDNSGPAGEQEPRMTMVRTQDAPRPH